MTSYTLTQPHMGIYIPAGIWATQFDFAPQTVLLVFASHYYDTDDYIRSYAEFLNYRNSFVDKHIG